MFCQIFKRRLRIHAGRVFHTLLPQGFEGEIFLCGGAFKPLLRKGAPINDLDLWVRNRKDREKLCAALTARGAVLLKDFHPFCIKFRLDGQIIEITYHNVKDGTIADVVNTFDLSISGMGVRYHQGRVVEAHISDECWEAVRHRHVTVMPSYLCLLMMEKPPSLIRTLHRMGQQAAELGFDVHTEEEARLWELYWHDYSEEQRKKAMDLYFDTVVAYKGQHNEHLVRRAAMGLPPAGRSRSAKHEPVKLRPRVA